MKKKVINAFYALFVKSFISLLMKLK